MQSSHCKNCRNSQRREKMGKAWITFKRRSNLILGRVLHLGLFILASANKYDQILCPRPHLATINLEFHYMVRKFHI